MISFTWTDPRGARIAPGAFADQVGKAIAVHVGGASRPLRGTLISATVPDDGRCAHLVIDIEPELGMPEVPGIEVLPEVPTDPGWLTSALRDLYEEYRSIEPWKDYRG